jgi:hypothetical protein
MLTEVIEAQTYLKKKFNGNDVPAGTYAIPTETSKGKAFMKVTVNPEGYLGGFDLFWDEEFTQSWYEKKNKK